jgi:4-amino-4-deoxy-L-arabinose transferase-like glycosyltransferase
LTFQTTYPRFRRLPAGLSVLGLAEWLTRSHWRAVAGLIILALVSFLPGIAGIPPVDRDEARFAQSTKQMLETGNYVDIRFQEGTRYKKPIGIYWLQAALVKLTGQGAEAPIAAYRLASLLGALAAVLLTYWAAMPLFGRSAAFIAASAMAVSVILAAEAHLAKTDAVLLATVLLTQGSLARIYLSDRTRPPPLLAALCFWIGLGLGILVKGPIVLMVAGLTALSLAIVDRDARWLLRLRPLIGVPLAAAIVLPRFIAILTIAGRDFIGQSVGHDLLGKLGGGQEGHAAPPGTHFALFWLIFWPAAALLPAATQWIWRERGDPAVRLSLAWLVPSLLVFEAVVTKLPHYPLPVYPAVAALLGGAVAARGLAGGWLLARAPAILAAVGGILVATVLVVAIARFGGGITPAAVAVAVLGIVLAAGSIVVSLKGAPLAGIALLAVAALPIHVLTFGIAAPAVAGLWLTPRIAAALERDAPCSDRVVASAGYQEASLIFTVGTGIKFVDGAAAAAVFLAGPGCRVALVDARIEPVFLRRAKVAKLGVVKKETIAGLNIGRVAMTEVGLFMAAAGPAH